MDNNVTELHNPAKEQSWQALVNVLRETSSEEFSLLAKGQFSEFYRPTLEPLFHSLAKLRPELIVYGECKDLRPPAFDAWFEVLTHLLRQHSKVPVLRDSFTDVHDCLTFANPHRPDVWHVELNDAQRVMLMQLCQCLGNLGMELIAHGDAVNEPYFKANPEARRKTA